MYDSVINICNSDLDGILEVGATWWRKKDMGTSARCSVSPFGALGSSGQEHSLPPPLSPLTRTPLSNAPRSSSHPGSSLKPSPASQMPACSDACIRSPPDCLLPASVLPPNQLPNIPVIYSPVCDRLPNSPVPVNKELYLSPLCSSDCGSGTSLEIACHLG